MEDTEDEFRDKCDKSFHIIQRGETKVWNKRKLSRWVIIHIKECGKDFLKYYSAERVGFVCNACTCRKKPFGAGTNQCMALLALDLECNFYLLRMFIKFDASI